MKHILSKLNKWLIRKRHCKTYMVGLVPKLVKDVFRKTITFKAGGTYLWTHTGKMYELINSQWQEMKR